MRTARYMATLSAVFTHPVLQAFHRRLLAAGKVKKVVLDTETELVASTAFIDEFGTAAASERVGHRSQAAAWACARPE
jgi:hypothetical protein